MKLSTKFFVFITLRAFTTIFIVGIIFYFFSKNNFQNDSSQTSVLILGSALIIIVLLSSILTYLVLRKTVLVPILLLTKTVDAIAAGDLHKRAVVSSKDEIGELALNFNKMTDQLISSKATAEKRETYIAENITQLENAKRAMVHLLKDLNKDKLNIEEAKVKADAILESIGDGIIATDEKGNIILMNKMAQEMLGYSMEEVRDKNLMSIIPMSDEKNVLTPGERPLVQAISSGTKTSETYYLTRKDKTVFPAAVVVTPISIENKIIGVIEVFRDVTREREVDRMKTEFISLASHQLRTPLSAMKWFSEMLLAGDVGELNAEQKETVKNIDQSNDRMIELVNSLLDVSRIESGRIIVDPVPTNLEKLTKEVQIDLKGKIEEKHQTFVIKIDAGLPDVNIDPKLIRQVYMNLLTNAIKYTPKEGTISIFIYQKDNQIVSQVSDDGYGIPEKEHDKVFQKFYRGENIVKIETDGNGLGMYLVKAIIESSKGKIWFESVEGKGTSFFFSLPILPINS